MNLFCTTHTLAALGALSTQILTNSAFARVCERGLGMPEEGRSRAAGKRNSNTHGARTTAKCARHGRSGASGGVVACPLKVHLTLPGTRMARGQSAESIRWWRGSGSGGRQSITDPYLDGRHVCTPTHSTVNQGRRGGVRHVLRRYISCYRATSPIRKRPPPRIPMRP